MRSTGKQMDQMNSNERRAAFSLAGIYSMRMLGLFMILPIFSLYTDKLASATPTLIGLAIGIYGLTQGILQIPFGMLSDRIGRKPVIVAGLLLFALGSIVAAMSDSVYGVIIGRAIQGSGAIAAAVMALAADLTREEHRTKAMAVIGMSIGASFALAMVLGPVLNGFIGLSGIFWFTAVMAVFGILILIYVVPNPLTSRVHRDAEPVPAQFKRVLSDGQLLRLDLGIMVLHIIITASFVSVPLILERQAGLAGANHWWVYLPVLLLSVVAMVPFIIVAERKRRMKSVFLGAIMVLGLSMLAMANIEYTVWNIALVLFVFFTAFNLLEASLPSLVSKIAPPASKGTAMGFYSSSQFFGAFIGGTLGGIIMGNFGYEAVFLLAAGMALIWLVAASSMKSPRYLTNQLLNIGKVDEQQARHLTIALTGVRGVAEAVVIPEDGVAYLKVDSKALDEEALAAFSIADA